MGGMPLDETLAHDRSAPGEVRRALAGFLTRSGLPQAIEDAQLLATELVTNALRHARGPIGVHAHIRDGFLHLEVRDSAAECPPVRRVATPDDETGRGIELVEKLSSRWGWQAEDQYKIVWFDLRV